MAVLEFRKLWDCSSPGGGVVTVWKVFGVEVTKSSTCYRGSERPTAQSMVVTG